MENNSDYHYVPAQRTVGFFEAISRGFSNYITFSGRASRSEYWWWFIFWSIVGYLIMLLISNQQTAQTVDYIIGAIIFLPSLTLWFRRLHDTGRSAWWLLINFIPVVGTIVLFVFCCLPSQPIENRFGPVPNRV